MNLGEENRVDERIKDSDVIKTLYKITNQIKGVLVKNQIWINNSGWVSLEKVLKIIGGVFVTSYAARHYGPALYGEMSFTLAIVLIFQNISKLGIDSIVVREVAKNEKKAGVWIGTSLLLRSVIGVFLYILFLIYIYMFCENKNILMMSNILGIIISIQSIEALDFWFQATSRNKVGAACRSIAYICTCSIKVILIISLASIYVYSISYLFEIVLAGGGLIYLAIREGKFAILEYKLRYLIIMIKEGFPYLISSVLIIIYMKIDALMIMKYMGVEQFGVYSAVTTIAQSLIFIPASICVSLAPNIAKIKEKDEEKYMYEIKNTIAMLSNIGWAISIFILIFSGQIIKSMYGDKYYEGINVLRLYGFTNLFICNGLAQNLWIINNKRSVVALFNTLLGAISSIILGVVLIPKYGLNGAAISAVVSQSISCIFSNIFFSREILNIQIKSMFFYRK